jgi:hypothetical protein
MYFGFEVIADIHALVSLIILVYTLIENKSTFGVSIHYFVLLFISRAPKLIAFIFLIGSPSLVPYHVVKDSLFIGSIVFLLFFKILYSHLIVYIVGYMVFSYFPETSFATKQEKKEGKIIVIASVVFSLLLSLYLVPEYYQVCT